MGKENEYQGRLDSWPGGSNYGEKKMRGVLLLAEDVSQYRSRRQKSKKEVAAKNYLIKFKVLQVERIRWKLKGGPAIKPVKNESTNVKRDFSVTSHSLIPHSSSAIEEEGYSRALSSSSRSHAMYRFVQATTIQPR
ncbi:hypothetical protein AVEN_227102-1 [Araneus ventricosus]|uniref:Uncharacterized protein n=1 Tax=Araneus ventricosus TaxID=182803 RepID=A0A4Y2BUH9_ARAVE|nr:hypothetical protein AVEN_227102-1 [Araneus ventricosus]